MININSNTYKTIKGSATKKNKSLKAKSFSPLINKKLLVHSLKTLEVQSIKLCDSLLKVNIKTKDKYVCKNYNDNEVKKILLHNLRASKHLDVSRFIPPIQLLSNCWFNTMYVAFFLVIKAESFLDFLEN